MTWTVLEGDCLTLMETLEPESIDAIVTDPPYGLGFMGKAWDALPPGQPWAEECLRVLKPGGHLLAFGGTRTYHRLAVAIEDAGFEIRDTIAWMYGSGFPKSMNVAKAVSAQVQTGGSSRRNQRQAAMGESYTPNEGFGKGGQRTTITTTVRAPEDQYIAPEAAQWEGWGTALKPAYEPIVVARKPLAEKTIARNVLEHGTGAMNIDGTRVGPPPGYSYPNGAGGSSFTVGGGVDGTRTAPVTSPSGRWPANLMLDEDAASVLDAQAPVSRFFYVAKASKAERGEGNNHPTVKPISVMQWLVRLVTPPGGIVLDPFLGSGTTGIAAINEGFSFVGIERDEKYVTIALNRIAYANGQHLSPAMEDRLYG